MTRMLIKFEAKLTAGIKFDEGSKVFVTFAPALNLYSQGETELQAKHALRDAVQSFLSVAYKNKVLDRCLKLDGFKKDAEGENQGIFQEATEYINVEEMILERNKFRDVFEIPASLPLEAVMPCEERLAVA